LRSSTMELVLITACVQIGIATLGITLLRRSQDRKNALLTVGGPQLNAKGYVRHVLWFMLTAALPYMIYRTVMENVNGFAYGRWMYELELGVRIEAFFPKTGAHNGRLLLAAASESNLTVDGYTTSVTSLAEHSYRLVERKFFSLPKLLLLPAMLARQPMLVATAFPAAIGLDFARAHVMGKLTSRLERIRRRRQDLKNLQTKIEQHDSRNEDLIQHTGFKNMTEAQWRKVATEIRHLEKQLDTLQSVKSFANHLYIVDFVTPGIEIVMAFLLEMSHITISDISLYIRVVEDAIDVLLTRTRQEGVLAQMKTSIRRIDELQDGLDRTLAREGVLCGTDTSDELLVRGLKYQRGNTIVHIPDLKLPPGIYAVTGPNGCGKSTLFSVLTSCSSNVTPLSGGVEILALDTLILPSDNLVWITQQLYCPLFVEPSKWFFQQMDSDQLEHVEEVMSNLFAELEFRKNDNEGSSNEVSLEELYVVQDDWYRGLSGGQRCKAEFIRQVFSRKSCPRILLVDETFAPIDTQSKKLVQQKLKKFCAKSVVLVIHHTEQNEECVPSGGFFDGNVRFANGIVKLTATCRW